MAYCSLSIADSHFRTSPGRGFVEAIRIGLNRDNLVTEKAPTEEERSDDELTNS